MSDDPFADRPSEQGFDWGGDPSGGPPPGSTPGWGSDPGPGAVVRSASVGKRVGALIIDYVGLFIVYVVLSIIVGAGAVAMIMAGGTATGTRFLSWLLGVAIVLAYFGLMEAQVGGQTLAKKLFGIKVVMADGSAATLQATLMRRLPLAVVIIIPTGIGWLVGFGLALAVLITTIQDEVEHRGLHDKWAGTKVIDA
jgi:uncharacterized RDD family membrane protein YckC